MLHSVKIPDINSMSGKLLGRLLNGEVIYNQEAKNFLDTPCPATHMSYLCVNKGWNVYIKRAVFRSKSSNGYDVNCTKYWIERDVILELMQNPRVQAFRDGYNKKCNI